MVGESRRQVVKAYLVQFEEEHKERRATFLQFDQRNHKNIVANGGLFGGSGGGGGSVAQSRWMLHEDLKELWRVMRDRQGERARVRSLFLEVLVRGGAGY